MQTQMLHATGPLKAGSLLANRYRIIERIGEGGFGSVYKAHDTKHRHRPVAIKEIDLAVLSPRQIIEATDTYNREVTILSHLRHRNLPHVYDHFTDPSHWYLVSQYIEGETLEEYLQHAADGHLTVEEVSTIGIQLTNVLHYLHSHYPPIIFRDVKPANIMRTRRGRIYLIDFGIARHFNSEKRRDTGPFGSPGYAAPEQYGRAQSTEQTDIYGLGATLHTLLTGREPFSDDPATPPTSPPGKKTLQFLQFLDSMQATDPADRPRSVREVKERLISNRPWLKALSLLRGLLIGSSVWLILLFFPFISPHPGWIVLGFAVCFVLWVFNLISQCALVLYYFFFAHPRRHLRACGILLTLTLFLILAFHFGWLSSLVNAFTHPFNSGP